MTRTGTRTCQTCQVIGLVDIRARDWAISALIASSEAVKQFGFSIRWRGIVFRDGQFSPLINRLPRELYIGLREWYRTVVDRLFHGQLILH